MHCSLYLSSTFDINTSYTLHCSFGCLLLLVFVFFLFLSCLFSNLSLLDSCLSSCFGSFLIFLSFVTSFVFLSRFFFSSVTSNNGFSLGGSSTINLATILFSIFDSICCSIFDIDIFSILDSIFSALYIGILSILVVNCSSVFSTLQSLFFTTPSICLAIIGSDFLVADCEVISESCFSSCNSFSFNLNSLSLSNFSLLISSNLAFISSCLFVVSILCFNLSSNLLFLLFLSLNPSGFLDFLAITCLRGFSFKVTLLSSSDLDVVSTRAEFDFIATTPS